MSEAALWLVEQLLKQVPWHDVAKEILRLAKAKVLETSSPIDDDFCKVLAQLLGIDYDQN